MTSCHRNGEASATRLGLRSIKLKCARLFPPCCRRRWREQGRGGRGRARQRRREQPRCRPSAHPGPRLQSELRPWRREVETELLLRRERKEPIVQPVGPPPGTKGSEGQPQGVLTPWSSEQLALGLARPHQSPDEGTKVTSEIPTPRKRPRTPSARIILRAVSKPGSARVGGKAVRRTGVWLAGFS